MKNDYPFLMYDTSHGGEDDLIESCTTKSSVTTLAVLVAFVAGIVAGALL